MRTFLSQTSLTRLSSPKSQTLNRPPVSSVLSGTRLMLRTAGGGNVRNSSVWVQTARCSQRQRSQNSTTMLKPVCWAGCGGTKVVGSSRAGSSTFLGLSAGGAPSAGGAAGDGRARGASSSGSAAWDVERRAATAYRSLPRTLRLEMRLQEGARGEGLTVSFGGREDELDGRGCKPGART